MTIQVSSPEISSRVAAASNQANFALSLQQKANTQDLDLPIETATWLAQIRQKTSDRLQTLQFPTTKHEEWKYTDLSQLAQLDWQVEQSQALDHQARDFVQGEILAESQNSVLAFLNGQYVPQLSNTSNLPKNVIAGSLIELAQQEQIWAVLRSPLEKYLGQYTDSQDFFSALNSACLRDIAVVFIPRNEIVIHPLQILFAAHANQPLVAQPRCLVIAEANSSLTLVETYTGIDAQPYFTNAVTEMWLGENAQVNHTRVQQEGTLAFHIGATVIAQSRYSRYTNYAVSLGAALSRYTPHVLQIAEQTETELNGLTFANGESLADTHSTISHKFPHGSSKQVQKNIAGDRAHVVFNGKILVAKEAQLTDSSQLSRNLLLSPKARVDTKPQLEIFADNVKCAHGATVSQLDEEELFYLQSRGIDLTSAQSMLTYGFAAEVISQIPVPSLCQTLSDTVLARTQTN